MGSGTSRRGHEAAAAHIAQGIFKTSGAMSLVLAGGGPGTANVLSGVICALAEGVPMFVVTAQRRADVVYPSKPGIFQAMDQQEMFRPMTKWKRRGAPVGANSRDRLARLPRGAGRATGPGYIST